MSTAEKLDDLDQIVKNIESLKVSDVAKLVTKLEDALGVTAAAPMAVAAAPAAGAAAPAAEEKTEFDVVLKSVDPSKKIAAIKAVRAVDSKLDLKAAKAVVDEAPKTVASGLSKDEAEKVKKTFEEAGAEVEIK